MITQYRTVILAYTVGCIGICMSLVSMRVQLEGQDNPGSEGRRVRSIQHSISVGTRIGIDVPCDAIKTPFGWILQAQAFQTTSIQLADGNRTVGQWALESGGCALIIDDSEAIAIVPDGKARDAFPSIAESLQHTASSATARAIGDIDFIGHVVESVQAQRGSFPSTLQELLAYKDSVSGSSLPLRDPWGREYRIMREERVTVTSYGADGVSGGLGEGRDVVRSIVVAR